MEISNNIGTPVSAVLTKGIVRWRNRQWEPLLECGDTSELPSANDSVRSLVHVGTDCLSSADRQLIDIADD